MIIEIGYEFQSDKNSPAETSWTYFYVKGNDLEKAKTKAKTYWKKFITELGWTKKTKLIHIEEIKNGKSYTPQHIIVNNAELPPARKRRSTQQKAPPRSPRTSSSPPKTKNKKGV